MSSEPTPSIESGTPPVSTTSIDSSLPPVSTTSEADVNALAARVAALETRFSPDSWVFGTSFFKRAFAMWGHVVVANLIIGIIVSALFFACTVIFGLSIAGLTNR